MKLHEYQAKELLQKYGVAIQGGVPIKSMEHFDAAVDTLKSNGVSQIVVKSQIHAGGRGKGTVYHKHNRNEVAVEGGVKFFGDNFEKAKDIRRKSFRQYSCNASDRTRRKRSSDTFHCRRA
jgi:succinyl-CoA synthetase beta subunit